ncbi:MAG: hypothetical protein ACT4O9_07630 [Blastocatellia bacterium]
MLARFPARIPDAKEFALKNRVLFIESSDGIGIDVSLCAFDFEANMISRSVYQEFLPDLKLKVCTAEDLIVSKSFAARPRDSPDVESILIKQIGLDWNYIIGQLTPLAEIKYEPEILDKLGNLRKQFYEE